MGRRANIRVAAVAVAILAMTLAAAGMVWFPRPGPEPEPVPGPITFRPVSHNMSGLLEASPEAFDGLDVVLKPVRHDGFEPTIGVTSKGHIFVAGGGATVWRSTDHGKAWRDVADHATDVDQDPYLWVDQATDRIFSVPNQGACSDIRWSDKGGDAGSWQGPTDPSIPILSAAFPIARGGCGAPRHDHQSLVTGPPKEGQDQPQGYPNIVYYAYTRIGTHERDPAGGIWMSRSLDGGKSWGVDSPRIFDGCQQGYSGVPAVAPNGTVYVAMPGCTGLWVAASYNQGQTWTVTALDSEGMGGGSAAAGGYSTLSTNPAVAVDGAGNAYALWAGDNGSLHLSRSFDDGRTWSAPVNATPPGLNVTAFSAMTAGDSGRIAIAYLATTANATKTATAWQSREAHFAAEGTPWHLFVGWSLDATEDDPVFTTWQATMDDDPVHVGAIWQAGDPPTDPPNRQLRDFIGMTEEGGRVHVAYADSCDRCERSAPTARLWVAVASGGPSLIGRTLSDYPGHERDSVLVRGLA